MQLVYFFILSLALHAAALAYPVSFAERSRAEVFRVTIIPMAQTLNGAASKGGSGFPGPRALAKSRPSMAPAREPVVDTKSAHSPDPQAPPVEPIEQQASESNLTLVSATQAAPGKNRNVISGSKSVAPYSADVTGTDGKEFGSTSPGFGHGSGSGIGADLSGIGLALTQARYRETPRPDYPESARREGREGRVLLRVLIDDQGRSKQVEINRSSGSDALDRAATEAIKRWRFYPARYGDRAIDSWIKIPIEFALANANAR